MFMKSVLVSLFLSVCCVASVSAQTLNEAKELYKQGKFAKVLPVFESEYHAKPADPSLNQWYGVCLFETGGNMKKAEECILFASTKGIQDSFFYLGQIYMRQFRIEEADAAFEKYHALLTKKGGKKKKEEIEREEAALARLNKERDVLSRLKRMVFNTEDIQIIDSLVVDKSSFLSAYKMSLSSGKLDYFNSVFNSNKPVESTVYFNEKGTKIYYAQPDSSSTYSLFSMEKLLDKYENEKKLSANNFGLAGNLNYPYLMSDGVTIYFAAEDQETLGGYDLFVSRYNLNNDTYLSPERLNMPFNSPDNDYMLVVDDEKGVGWFASDRFQPQDKVCVYTFIPNATVKIVNSEDERYMVSRAQIHAIKDSWIEGKDYTKLIATARKNAVVEEAPVRDFEFVINDNYTYYAWHEFKSEAARNTHFKAFQMRQEWQSVKEKLEKARADYKDASQESKRKMTASILELESKEDQLRNSIPALEVQARNQEIEALK